MSTTSTYRWSNSSVLAFSGTHDPVEKMEREARGIAFEAMENGWGGPPFDPIKLAEILNIKVTASGDVKDAKTVFRNKKPHIEYNPNKPRGRIRFSIAHEIAHTLFPDCHEKTRYRHTSEFSSDNWQLETLCNIGASELLMPVGSGLEFATDELAINKVLELRSEYDVSTEAILIRLAKLTEKPVSIFCASKSNDDEQSNKYRIDYTINSDSWPYVTLTGKEIASDLLYGCSAIGYTVTGNEALPNIESSLHIECVGLPPFPGRKSPRVAGIIFAETPPAPKRNILYHEGDATRPGGHGEKIIAHIVNDKTTNWGGGGFAVSLKKRYPDTQSDFKNWVDFDKSNLCLGRSHFTTINDGLHVFSMIAQHGYGRSAAPRIRYKALETCLENLSYRAKKICASVHVPRIGAGNAGGKWPVIEEIIQNTLVREGIKVNVYDFESPSRNMSLEF